VALLLLINLFNYIDRFVLASTLSPIGAELLPDDPFQKSKMGALATAFLVTYMVLAPIFGWLADRVPRWWIIGGAVIAWSLASGGSGLAHTYEVLLLTRCLVGVGEAAYGPVAPTLIADLFPVERRGRVFAWFYAAIPVGSALGYILGGEMAGKGGPGWRWAFYSVVPPGVLLGLWCFLMREPRRGQTDELGDRPVRRAGLSDYKALLRVRSYVLNTLGMTAMTFAIGALAIWMPTYLKEAGVQGFLGRTPDTVFGAVTALAGLVATLLGGLVGDRLRNRLTGSYFVVSGIAMIVGFPVVLLVLVTPPPWIWIVIFLAEFCLFFNTGPTNTIIANVTHPSIRASAFALNIFVIHALGDAISPPIIGYLADITGRLTAGFALVSLTVLLGGIVWLWGARFLEEDTRRAPTSLDMP
jgi:MFS family permease